MRGHTSYEISISKDCSAPLTALLLVTTCFAAPHTATEKALPLTVVGVPDDDDTTGLTASNGQVKVRLGTIDAHELKQPSGQVARKALGLTRTERW